MANKKILAPYSRFRIDHMKFNANGYRFCNKNDIKILKKVDPNLAIFKYQDGVELNPKQKQKKKIKQEAPDVHKNTKHKS